MIILNDFRINKINEYSEIFNKFSDKYKVPSICIASLCIIESGLSKECITGNDRKDVGLMQISINAVKEVKLPFTKIDDLLKPENNINAGTAYLRHMFNKFKEIKDINNRASFAVASYNTGRKHINSLLDLVRKIEGKSIKELGRWQYWGFSKMFLPRITGERSWITMFHVWKFWEYIAKLQDLINSNTIKINNRSINDWGD